MKSVRISNNAAWLAESDELLMVNHFTNKAIVLKSNSKEMVELIIAGTSIQDVITQMSKKYNRNIDEMESEVDVFLNKLQSVGFIESNETSV